MPERRDFRAEFSMIAGTFENVGEMFELGTPIGEYKSVPKRGVLRNVGFLLLVLGEALIFVGGFSPYFYDGSETRATLVAIGAVIAFFGLLSLHSGLSYEPSRVLLFTDGLEHQKAGKNRVIRWRDVAGVWQAVTKHYTNGVYTRTTHTYTLQTSDGQKLILNDVIKHVEALGELIQQKITDLRLPEALSQYQMGNTITFGPIAINQMGISKGNQTAPWPEIQGVTVEKGVFRVKKAGAWFNFANVPVASIPNLFILLVLVDRIIGINAKKSGR